MKTLALMAVAATVLSGGQAVAQDLGDKSVSIALSGVKFG